MALLKFKKVIKQEQHPAALRGTKIHEAAEDFVKGDSPMIKELKIYEERFNELKDDYKRGAVELEGDWGFTKDWEKTGWMAENVWARIKLDAYVQESPTHARVIDYKTGKKFGNEVSHSQQCQLYEIASFLRVPELQSVQSELWYLDHKVKPTIRQVTRTQAMAAFPSYNARAIKMTTAIDFPAHANKYNCKWCDFKGTEFCPEGVE